MNKYTEKQLWAFVNRANDLEKINVAIAWLKEHGEMRNGSWKLWDDLMDTLAYKHRELTTNFLY